MKKAMLIAAIGLIGSSLLVGCGGDKKDTANTQNNTQTTQSNDNSTQNTQSSNDNSSQDSNKSTQSNNNSAYDKVYKAGFYQVGKDLPAGEYLVVGDKITKEAETSVEVTKDSKKEQEIFDESVMGNVYVTVENGQYIDVENGDIYPVELAPSNTPKDKVYKDGMYKVGKDIKAGTYDVKALKDDADIKIYKDSSHSKSSLISEKEFKNTEKVTLKDGQYIELDDAQITVK
ncbi:hypothetical protein [Clostridium sp.]|uniref:hypothetical protein n=1 Tax=Clostridium sp. TaxID=1506 RepID=UPI002A90A07E|nr:hypothetical protein [Clostridium sp.]MDY6013009.1 hypothetical protein [Clostridium sp.]